MFKLVKGKQILFDVETDKSDIKFREEIGRTYLNMKIDEGKTLGIFYFNFVLLLLNMVFAVFVSNIFVIGILLSLYSSYQSHENYLSAWSKRNKFGRKKVIRIDIEKRPAIIDKGPQVPWIKADKTVKF
ncbi:MAG: hypothetical protein ABH986_05615 [archaeon]